MRIVLKQVQPMQYTTSGLMQLTSTCKLNKKLGMVSPKATQNWEPLLLESARLNSNPFGPNPDKPNHVKGRWMEYQGIKNWDGLLDPLDENLRGEIIRYGQFVDMAYKAFECDPTSSSYASCRFSRKTLFQKSGFPQTGYQITKNLHATSGIDLPHWTNKIPGGWVSTQSSWIGYVAVCKDKKEIARLGRRDIVIALRGTTTFLEWLENLRASLTDLHNESSGPMVACGFLSLFTSGANTRGSLQHLVREEIKKILQTYCDEPLSLTITGHSLGAALAILIAYDIKTTFKTSPLITVVSFGGPRVGNDKFRYHVENQGTKVLRIVNSEDIVTKVPGTILDKELIPVQAPNWIVPTYRNQWAYVDVGRELRLTSRASPYLSRGFDVATCHELGTYLHLVNGFVSSTCPFRETTRKMTNNYAKERMTKKDSDQHFLQRSSV